MANLVRPVLPAHTHTPSERRTRLTLSPAAPEARDNSTTAAAAHDDSRDDDDAPSDAHDDDDGDDDDGTPKSKKRRGAAGAARKRKAPEGLQAGADVKRDNDLYSESSRSLS